VNVCPTFESGGPSGIAEALRVVDCMSGEAASFAFARLFGSNALLGQALTAALTLYIAFYAIGLLTGRASLSVSSLTPRMMTLGIALTFATSWVAYQSVVWNLLVGAPDQIASLLMGTQGSATGLFADRLDTIFTVVAQAATTVEAGAPTGSTSSLASGPDMLWISALMLLLGTVGVLVVARIALATMLALGPIFIICSLFEGSRGLFEGWLKSAVLFAIAPLLAVLIGGGTITLLSPMLDSLAMGGGQIPLRLTTTLLLASTVYCALMFVALKVAATIVAGWRLPFGARQRSAGSTAALSAPSDLSLSATDLEPAISRASNRDPRVNSIVSAAAGGSVPAADRVLAPIYSRDGPTTASVDAMPQISGIPRSDHRLGSLSRRYRPRVAQLQRTES
jgi:type IV secretion system protein VirB6